MAYKEVLRVEIQEVIRRWQSGGSQRQIAEGTGLSRATVRKYLSAAKGEGIAQDGPAPSEEQLSRLAGISRAGPRQVETPVEDSLAPWADQIYQWLTGDRLKVTRVQELLSARGLYGVVHVVAPVHQEAQLGTAQRPHGAHGRHRVPARWPRWTSADWG